MVAGVPPEQDLPMRRMLAGTLLALFTVGSVAGLAVPANADAAKPSIQQFLKIRTPAAPSILPDGSLLYRDWPDGVFQLYRAVPKNAASPSYAPGEVTVTQLTNFPDGLAGYSLSPDGKRVVLIHARGGNENTQLTLLDPMAAPGAPTTPIVSNPKVQARLNQWAYDGSYIIYSVNDESPEDFYIYRYDFADGKITKLLSEKGDWGAADITHDGKRMLVQHLVSASNTELFELDLATGKRTDVTIKPEGGTAACGSVGYMPGERAVLMTSDWKDGRSRLYVRDLKSGAVKEPMPALSSGSWMAPSRTRIGSSWPSPSTRTATVRPTCTRFRTQAAARAHRREGCAGRLELRKGTFIWSLSNARRPSTAFATTFSKTAKKPEDHATRQLTWTDNQGIDFASFSLPETRHLQGVRRPRDLGVPVPAAGLPEGHGDPVHRQLPRRPGVPASAQFQRRGPVPADARLRAAQAQCPRQHGYGREFQMLDDYKKRWDSVRDGVDAAEWLVASGYSQPGRMATFGGSYGGFMSVACIVEDQERVDRGARKERLFGASVNVVGIANLRTFLERTSGYRRALREVEYGPLTDKEFLESVSSLNKVDKIQVPMFIGHGFNDPRVPVEEAMQLAAALKQRGRNPRVFIAPDEGHGFAKLDNRIYFNERVVSFLEETIGKSAPQAMSNP
jgi:dienelactone hydrolase/Tol biopolymer transport system component